MRLPSSAEGFSLLEVVVALTVFSLGALATMNVLTQSSQTAGVREARLIAGIVAENQMALAMLGQDAPPLGDMRGRERAMQRDWVWERRITPSADPRILRIDVRVRAETGQQILAELASFRAAR